ncbi:MAG TPA: HAMP domain-containing sensor histidine kinase [Solirubrobacterales bacterium]|nr:HAMP domain-containing sensor histidine kinase [Solirubrobacterales bacterium]
MDLANTAAGWPLAASMAVVLTAQGLRAGRRRYALNEALHELRRPLQAIALASGTGTGEVRSVDGSVELAATALERLDREINGGPAAAARGAVRFQPLLQVSVGRWRARAAMGGGSLELRWRAGGAVVIGERCGLSQALDNLIVNAIEHGGPSIVVEARRRSGRLRVSVADSGRSSRPESRRENPAEVIARLSGRRRHGHGLPVVRQVAAAHGGRFVLRRSEQGSLAVLELPLAADDAPQAA